MTHCLFPLTRWAGLILLSLLMTACVTGKTDGGLSSLGKSDVDTIVEIHQRELMAELKTLMIKLYKRNPGQRYDLGQRSIEESVNLVFEQPLNFNYYPGWSEQKDNDIIRLAFDDNYQGDRVLALGVGLKRMLMASYGNNTEFYYFTSIDQQKLYNSARNIEIAAWLLAERKNAQNEPLILSDSLEDESRNLSFQRLIGKMIATQDNLAIIVSEKTGRLLKTIVVQAASMAFLPI
jgi:hypothetical protein